MKVRFNVDNGANIHSCRSEVIDTEDLGYTDEEWKALDDDQKWEEAKMWADNYIEIYYEEL